MPKIKIPKIEQPKQEKEYSETKKQVAYEYYKQKRDLGKDYLRQLKSLDRKRVSRKSDFFPQIQTKQTYKNYLNTFKRKSQNLQP